MDAAVSHEDITKILEKKQQADEKKSSRRKEFQEAVEKGEKKLLVEQTPSGLYYLQFKGGGTLPEELRGKFTSIDRIRKIVIARYGKDILE